MAIQSIFHTVVAQIVSRCFSPSPEDPSAASNALFVVLEVEATVSTVTLPPFCAGVVLETARV